VVDPPTSGALFASPAFQKLFREEWFTPVSGGNGSRTGGDGGDGCLDGSPQYSEGVWLPRWPLLRSDGGELAAAEGWGSV
jgi:hypothetical protein